MLNPLDFRLNQLVFGIYSFVGVIPLKFEHGTFFISHRAGRIRGVICGLVFAIVCGAATFKNLRLIQTLVLSSDKINLAHLPIQVTHFAGGNTVVYFFAVILREWPVVIALFNSSVQVTRGSTPLVAFVKKILLSGVQEMILMTCPLLLVGLAMMTITLFAVDPVRAEFSFSLFPQEYQTVPTLIGCLSLEYFFLNCGYCILSFGVVFHLSFFRTILDTIQHMSISFESFETTCKELRRVHLLVTLFNETQAATVYMVKWMCLSMQICSLFVGILLVFDMPIVSCFYLTIGIYNFIVFVVIYDRPFRIPQMTTEMKRRITLQLSSIETRNPSRWSPSQKRIDELNFQRYAPSLLEKRQRNRELRLLVKSIPMLEIKIGEFNAFQQDSIPEYVSFVSQQTASMLLAFH